METKKFIEPDPDVKNRLMKAFDEKYPARRNTGNDRLFRLMHYPVPLYQAGMAASVLLLFMFYLLLQNHRTSPEVVVADTIYIDKPVRIKDTVWMEKPGNRETGRMAGFRPVKKQHTAQPLPALSGNDLYSSQLQEAMVRLSVISGLDRDRSVTSDRELLMLVETVH